MSKNSLVDESRREFIKSVALLAVALPAVTVFNCSCQGRPRQEARNSSQQRNPTEIVGGACDGCEGIYEGMPQQLGWQTTIASASEPGEPLEISGMIYLPDGKTPAPNIVLYVYHTDAKGYYSPAANATGAARRHGHLRGWLKTDASGQYRFATIKPAPYPGMKEPAHIHPLIKEPAINEYWIDEYVFDDDPLLTEQKRSERQNRGGSGIIRLTRSSNGVWTGTRNITLGLNIPNYRRA